MNTKHVHISNYQYDLPDNRIAKFPMAERDRSKLLIYNKGKLGEDVFFHLPGYLPQGALMVFNNTKVIQARMHFRKETGAQIEIFLMEPACPTDYEQVFQTRASCAWYCMIGNLKKWKAGPLTRPFEVNGRRFTLTAARRLPSATETENHTTQQNASSTNHWIDFRWDVPDVSFAEILEAIGELPIPPYLNRATADSDKETYQTVYSKIKGSVAAPTAGLHFTDSVLAALDRRGIDREEVTLHVGAGTFKPVSSAAIADHNMHTEYICVRRQTLEKLLQHNVCAIAVGTTSVRTLESLYYMGVYLETHPDATEVDLHVDQWAPYERHNADGTVEQLNGALVDDISPAKAIGNLLDYLCRNRLETLHSATKIIIAPGYEYKIVRMLITNFHQPKSTLLLLVSAFVHGDWRSIYEYALAHDFRFLSYGDSSLLIP